MSNDPLPPSLAVVPNIPVQEQTMEQLIAERDYWERMVRTAPGRSSAWVASQFHKGCLKEIARRTEEGK